MTMQDKDYPKIQNEELTKLLDAVKSTSRLLEQPGDDLKQDAEELAVSLPLDSLWPTDNPWSVPSLRQLYSCAASTGRPIMTWTD